MRLGAGKVLQGSAIGGGGQQAHVHLQAQVEVEADLVFAFGDHVVDAGVGGHVFNGGRGMPRFAGRTGCQQVEVAHGLAPAAQRTGRRDVVNSFELQKMSRDARGFFGGHVDAEAAGAAPKILDTLAQLFNLLDAHARQTVEAAGSMASASWSILDPPALDPPALVPSGLPIMPASQSRATVFGPMPGSLSSSRTPAPYFASSSSR